MRRDEEGLDAVAAGAVALAVVAIVGMGAFILLQREEAIDQHDAAVAQALANASASAAADLEAAAAAKRALERAAQPSPTPYPSAPPGFYRVQAGDSLFSITNDLGISVEQLLAWNLEDYPRLASSPAVEPGSLLKIEGPALAEAVDPPEVAIPIPPAPGPVAPAPGPVAPAPGPVASDWTVAMQARAEAYKADVSATYDAAVRRANYELSVAGFVSPGSTPEEMAARQRYAQLLAASNLQLAISSHMQWMNANPPATCFADAYRADIEIGRTLWAAAQAIMDGDGEDLSSALPARDAFMAHLAGYFSDCG